MAVEINGILHDFPASDKESENITRMLMKMLLKDSGLSLTKAVKKLNEIHPEHKTTTQNISNKLARDTLKFQEFRELAEVCGYQIALNKIGQTHLKQQPKSKEVYYNKTYNDLLIDGYADCESINFDLIIIAGANAEQAAKWIKENLDEELNETQEIMLMIAANRQFGVNCKPVAKGRNFQML